jgi:F0F1-type ATP synthase assembly protein I
MPDDKKKTEQQRREYRQMFEASALAWMFPIAIGLGALWGWGMDKWFGTWPWLTAIFTGFGFVAAFINLFRIGMRE